MDIRVEPRTGWKLKSFISVSCDSNPWLHGFIFFSRLLFVLVAGNKMFTCVSFGLLFHMSSPQYSIFSFSVAKFCLPHTVTPQVCMVTPTPFLHSRRDCVHQQWCSRHESPPTGLLTPLGSNHHHLIPLLYILLISHIPSFVYGYLSTLIGLPWFFFLIYVIPTFFHVKINKLGNTSYICVCVCVCVCVFYIKHKIALWQA